MNNVIHITLYGALALVTLALLVPALRRPASRLNRSLCFVAAMLLCWQAALVLYYASATPAAALYLHDMSLPFVAFASLAWFLYIIRFYGLESYFPTVVRVCLFIIPLFTLGVVLLTPFHNFLRADLQVVSLWPAHVMQVSRGPWFWYHSAYCYCLILVALVVALAQHRDINRLYRRTSSMLLLGLGITAAGSFLVLAAFVELDFSLLTATLALSIVFTTTRNDRGMETFMHARQEMLHYLGRGILILDDSGGVVSMNRAAAGLLSGQGIPAETASFREISARLAQLAERVSTLEDEGHGTDYHLPGDEVLNLREKPILDNGGSAIGTFVMLEDVRENRRAIEHLDTAAGMDALTGLSNRRKFEEKLVTLDQPVNLPLAVMMGDLNNLKHTNDSLGHAHGDIYIRLAAQLLKELCPPSAHIARVGGDEFTLLLPCCDEDAAQRLAGDIGAAFARTRGHPFTPSISLGWAIKHTPGEDLAGILRQADAAMYAAKRRYKAGGPPAK